MDAKYPIMIDAGKELLFLINRTYRPNFHQILIISKQFGHVYEICEICRFTKRNN